MASALALGQARKDGWTAPSDSGRSPSGEVSAGRRRATPRHTGRVPPAGPVLRLPHGAAAAPPPLAEAADDLGNLSEGAALAHEVAVRRVERHHRVPDAPAPLPLGVQPDDALHPLAHEPERPGLSL